MAFCVNSCLTPRIIGHTSGRSEATLPGSHFRYRRHVEQMVWLV